MLTNAQRAAVFGVTAVLATIAIGLQGGSLTSSQITARARCIPFPAGWIDDGGTKVVDIPDVQASQAALALLGYASPPATGAYGDMEVMGYPGLTAQGSPDPSLLQPLPPGISIGSDPADWTTRANPIQAGCQLLFRVNGVGGGVPTCACCARAGGTCLVNVTNRADGTTQQVQGAPDTTYGPGVFVPGGAGVVAKPCRETQGVALSSMPAACQ